MRSLRAFAVAVAVAAVGPAGAADLEVREYRNPARTVLADTLYGGLAGAAVSGGVIGYQVGIRDRQGYDWEPVLATGVGIGLAAGLVLGLLHVATEEPALVNGPVRDGYSWRDQLPRDRSRALTAPLRTIRW